jgi:hypothetical protein
MIKFRELFGLCIITLEVSPTLPSPSSPYPSFRMWPTFDCGKTECEIFLDLSLDNLK